MKYKGIGFNGPHLAAMPYKQFEKEVSHQLTKEEAKELYGLLQLKYDKQEVKDVDDCITIPTPAESGYRQGDSDEP